MTTVLASSALLAGSLALVELLRRAVRVPCELTRRIFFALVGTLAIPIVYQLSEPAERAIPFVFVTVFTYLSFRFELLATLEDDGPGLGSVLFPLACALLLGFSSRLHTAVSGILAVSFGDTLAAIVGRRMGTRRFHFLGHARTMEGTLAMFLGSSTAIAAVLIVLGSFDPHRAVAFALIAGTTAAAIETVCPYGIDNLVVPVTTAWTLSALERFSQ